MLLTQAGRGLRGGHSSWNGTDENKRAISIPSQSNSFASFQYFGGEDEMRSEYSLAGNIWKGLGKVFTTHFGNSPLKSDQDPAGFVFPEGIRFRILVAAILLFLGALVYFMGAKEGWGVDTQLNGARMQFHKKGDDEITKLGKNTTATDSNGSRRGRDRKQRGHEPKRDGRKESNEVEGLQQIEDEEEEDPDDHPANRLGKPDAVDLEEFDDFHPQDTLSPTRAPSPPTTSPDKETQGVDGRVQNDQEIDDRSIESIKKIENYESEDKSKSKESAGKHADLPEDQKVESKQKNEQEDNQRNTNGDKEDKKTGSK